MSRLDRQAYIYYYVLVPKYSYNNNVYWTDEFFDIYLPWMCKKIAEYEAMCGRKSISLNKTISPPGFRLNPEIIPERSLDPEIIPNSIIRHFGDVWKQLKLEFIPSFHKTKFSSDGISVFEFNFCRQSSSYHSQRTFLGLNIYKS